MARVPRLRVNLRQDDWPKRVCLASSQWRSYRCQWRRCFFFWERPKTWISALLIHIYVYCFALFDAWRQSADCLNAIKTLVYFPLKREGKCRCSLFLLFDSSNCFLNFEFGGSELIYLLLALSSEESAIEHSGRWCHCNHGSLLSAPFLFLSYEVCRIFLSRWICCEFWLFFFLICLLFLFFWSYFFWSWSEFSLRFIVQQVLSLEVGF